MKPEAVKHSSHIQSVERAMMLLGIMAEAGQEM